MGLSSFVVCWEAVIVNFMEMTLDYKCMSVPWKLCQWDCIVFRIDFVVCELFRHIMGSMQNLFLCWVLFLQEK